MRLLPVWRRKKDEFDMNFFHGLLEIPDWEKRHRLITIHTHLYIYIAITLSKRRSGNKMTSSVCFFCFEACMISFFP